VADPCCHDNEICVRRGDLDAYRLVPDYFSYSITAVLGEVPSDVDDDGGGSVVSGGGGRGVVGRVEDASVIPDSQRSASTSSLRRRQEASY